MNKTLMLAAVVVLLLALSPLPVLGQATDGNITGTVLDASSAVIPNASVQLENTATGVKRDTKTDVSGVYRFSNILVGTYRITAKAEGFTATTLENVDAVLNRTTTANLTLAVGAVATQVEVSEASALIDTTTSTIGSSFESQEAVYNPATLLPLGVYNLSLMSAGVASSGGVGLGEGPSIGGQRPRNNSFSIEGVDNNRKDVTGANIRVPNEAVAEFSVLQNQFNAEFGHSTGGQFNAVLRSGTNQIHGALYEDFQNRNLNAVDQADARSGFLSNPRYDQNVLGGSVGGPIIKNKLFYYGLVEYNPYGAASAPGSVIYAPTAAGFSMLDQLASQGKISQTNYDVLKQYLPVAASADGPGTTVLGQTIPTGGLSFTFPSYTNTYTWLASVDYSPTERDQLRFRYIASKTDGIDPNASPALPAFSGGRQIRQGMYTFSEFHTFSPVLTNEFRAAYAKYSDSIPTGDFSFPGLDMFPNIQIEQDLNLQLGPYPEAPQSGSQNTYQLVDNVTWIRGHHTIKAGIDTRRYIAPTTFIQRQRGDYDYSTLDLYLTDQQPDVLAARNLGGRPYWGNSWDFYWFLQDEWKIRNNITLTAGIRYEYKGIPHDDTLQTLNSVSNIPGVLEFNAPQAQKKNFAPRLGLTYSPGTTGKTVFRAGFGMAYDVYFDNLGTLSKPPQLETSKQLTGAENIQNFLANGGITGGSNDTSSMTPADWRMATATYIYDQHLPYSINWSFGVERVLAQDYTINVRYLGTRGVRLFTQSIINLKPTITPDHSLPTYLQAPTQAALDGLTLTQDQLFNEEDAGALYLPEFLNNDFTNAIFGFPNRGNSVYHGLAMEVTRRFSNGFLFKGAYTLSHNIDDSTADLFSTLLSPRRPQDFQNLRAERSSSFLDRRQRFTFTALYQSQWFGSHPNWFMKNMVGNWVISGTYTAESPQYATVQSGLDSNLNGDSAGDRVIVNPNGVTGTGSDISELTNSNGDVVAYLADNPNAQYIKAGYGAFANGGRQTLPLRGINDIDFAVTKSFNITESKKIEFRASAYNLFNHPQYTPGAINTVQAVATNTTRNNLIPGNPIFGDPTQVYSSNPRSMHLVLRFTF